MLLLESFFREISCSLRVQCVYIVIKKLYLGPSGTDIYKFNQIGEIV